MVDSDAPSDDDGTEDKAAFRTNRRTLLKAVGGLATVAGVSQMATRGASASETYDFSTTVDLADHAASGDRIDGVLSDLADHNTLIEVPDGTYQCGSVDFGGLENFGIAAKDGASPTFVAPESLGGRWFNFDGRNVLLDGITFDHNGHPRGTINLHMTGPWVCRNVDHVGQVMASAFRLACTDSNATGLLQDCTAVDGAVQGERGRGAFVPSGNNGEVVIDGCHFENMTDNCIYCSPSNGPVRVLNCFFKNNNISNVRVSMPATVRNVVVVNDSLARTHGGGRNQRGIWLRDRGSGNVTVENCDVTHTGDDDSHPILVEGGEGTVTDCCVRNDTSAAAVNPGGSYSGSGIHLSGDGDLSAPSDWVACSASGCTEPRTTAPEVDRTTSTETTTTETDSGNETGGSTDLPNVVTVHGDQGLAEYEFTVSGDLEPNTDGAGINSYDTIDGSTATGRVWGGRDSYRFGGEITDFSLSDAATVYVNGQVVDPADLGEPDLPNVVTVHGDQDLAEYEFTVSGDLEPNTDGAGINSYDTIDGSTATGRVWGGRDSYRFGGEITDFSLSDPATVTVNGTEVDPSQYGSGSPPRSTGTTSPRPDRGTTTRTSPPRGRSPTTTATSPRSRWKCWTTAEPSSTLPRRPSAANASTASSTS
ncbi:right-handed parallel beta-helix repeat-containing protein [Halosimplex aquaticum]